MLDPVFGNQHLVFQFHAFVTAFGGGTVRDLCLDRHPLYWIANEDMCMAVVGLAVVLSYLPVAALATSRTLVVADGLGLALFSVLGTALSLDHGLSPFLACLRTACLTRRCCRRLSPTGWMPLP